jgi:hypothetical protein
MLANSPPTPVRTMSAVFTSVTTTSATLVRQPTENGLTHSVSTRALIRTRSASTPVTHTPSPIQYGPIQPSKRKQGRLYCDACDLEFYLPYMLDNHQKSGLCSGSSSSSSSSGSCIFLSTFLLFSPFFTNDSYSETYKCTNTKCRSRRRSLFVLQHQRHPTHYPSG